MEIEFKWKMPIDEIQKMMTESSLLSGYIESKRIIKMHSVYYDTPDRKLKSRSLALRMRKENENEICYLKTSVKEENNLFVRNEYVFETNSLKCGIDYFLRRLELKTLFEGINLKEIQEICVIGFDRTVFDIRYSQKDRTFDAELCFDTGWGRNCDVKVPIAEIELEFINGDQELFGDYAVRLEELFSLEREVRSKIAQIK